MSISATHSFLSHDTIDAWMQARVGDAYAEMGAGMDVSGHRADAENALNAISAKLAAAKTNGGKTDGHLFEDIQNVMDAYGDVPGVAEALKAMIPTVSDEHVSSVQSGDNGNRSELPPIKLSDRQIDDWTKQVGDVVDGLGKADQLGMIHLNQLNSHINQTEQIASAITDSRNKTIDAIINRIG
ncbi:MAG: hypothetical protein ABIQ16_26995 [Polyangiaceae bacterium]